MFHAALSLLNTSRWPAFASGMAAYGSAEAATRVVRLATILIIARQISPTMLGTAALALSLFEIVRVLTNVGIGQRIIAASDDELDAVCNAAHGLFWIVCLSVMAIQLGVAAFTFAVFALNEVAAMLAVLSGVYLFMPGGLVQIFLAIRAQRMGATAQVAATQNIADCVLTMVLAVIWPSAWAIILPKLLTAPVWMVLARRTFKWSPDRCVEAAPLAKFATFGPAVLGTELFAAARLHGDKLLVGALLGTEALGHYYFAFNAGLGITLSLVTACNLVLFPQLAKLKSDQLQREYRRAFALSLAIILPIVAIQAGLAPIYVPIIFGENWVLAAPYLSILALAAIPLFIGALVGARWRAMNQPQTETGLMALATLAAIAGLFLGAQFDLAAACTGFGLGLAIILLPSALLSLRSPRLPSQQFVQGV